MVIWQDLISTHLHTPKDFLHTLREIGSPNFSFSRYSQGKAFLTGLWIDYVLTGEISFREHFTDAVEWLHTELFIRV